MKQTIFKVRILLLAINISTAACKDEGGHFVGSYVPSKSPLATCDDILAHWGYNVNDVFSSTTSMQVSYPRIEFSNPSISPISYKPSSQTLEISAIPTKLISSSTQNQLLSDSARYMSGQIQISNAGEFIDGSLLIEDNQVLVNAKVLAIGMNPVVNLTAGINRNYVSIVAQVQDGSLASSFGERDLLIFNLVYNNCNIDNFNNTWSCESLNPGAVAGKVKIPEYCPKIEFL